MEPYYQMSKKDGALGKDSLLLAYPFDFIPLVPIKAAKDRYVGSSLEQTITVFHHSTVHCSIIRADYQ